MAIREFVNTSISQRQAKRDYCINDFCNNAKDVLIRDSECCDTKKYYSKRYHITLT